jgi:membrane protease YdiL (CAAX protease family)
MPQERWDNPAPSPERQENLLPTARPVVLHEARPCQDISALATGTFFAQIRALFEIVIVFAVLFLLPFLFRLCFGETPSWLPQFFIDLDVYGRVLVMGSLATLTVFGFLRLDRQSFRSIGLYFKNLEDEIWTAFWALGLIFALNLAITIIVGFFLPDLAGKLAKERSQVLQMFPQISPIWLILVTAFVGFYEELVFRGFLITRLKVMTKNVWVAVFISSVIFGVVHNYQDKLAMVQITMIAFIFGTMYVRRKSLISPMLAHMAFDFINLAFVFTASKVPMKELEKILSQ